MHGVLRTTWKAFPRGGVRCPKAFRGRKTFEMSLLPLPYREGRGAHADGRQLALPTENDSGAALGCPLAPESPSKKRESAVTALQAAPPRAGPARGRAPLLFSSNCDCTTMNLNDGRTPGPGPRCSRLRLSLAFGGLGLRLRVAVDRDEVPGQAVCGDGVQTSAEQAASARRERWYEKRCSISAPQDTRLPERLFGKSAFCVRTF